MPIELIASFLPAVHGYLYFINSAVEALLLNNCVAFMNTVFPGP
jgi:hypothetical protein